jgi:hypothetical protein
MAEKIKKPRLSPGELAAQLRAKADRIEALEAERRRKFETRQLIIIGGAMVAEARTNAEFGKQLREVLKTRVTRPVDVQVMQAWLSTT